MSGPGQYLSDPTAGITRPADLPSARILRRSRNFKPRDCPYCGKRCYRPDTCTRVLHDVGDVVDGRPRDIPLEYSQPRCPKCRQSFNADLADYAWPKAHYPHRVVSLAVRLVIEDGLPYQAASWHLWREHRVVVPVATRQNWVEAGGKRAARQMWTSSRDWSLADFSGSSAVDELDEGPFCVLSLVDHPTCKRLLSPGRDHAPDHQAITALLRRFRMALQLRSLGLRGVTTEGAPLYPEPLPAVFGEVPHQICEFQSLNEDQALVQAVATVRKDVAARKPTLKRGRPSTPAAKCAVRQGARWQQKIGELFSPRYVFVQHDLTPAERRTWLRLTRGLPQLRTLRTVREEVYRLFARRCRPDTALLKLAKLRQRGRRFKPLGQLLKQTALSHLGQGADVLEDSRALYRGIMAFPQDSHR